MKDKPNFFISCEGDIERVCKVFTGWLKDEDSTALGQSHKIQVPNEYWAELFVDIYADEIANQDLADTAEKNIIDIVFIPKSPILDQEIMQALEEMSDEELLDALNDALDKDEDDDDDDDDEDQTNE